jgi:hypothetical protein
MNITEVISYKAFPPDFAISFLRKIRHCVPFEAVLREGFCPVGAYLVPFVNRLGHVVAWVPFAENQADSKSVFVRIAYAGDPSRVYRVNEDGSLEVVSRTANEDW